MLKANIEFGNTYRYFIFYVIIKYQQYFEIEIAIAIVEHFHYRKCYFNFKI